MEGRAWGSCWCLLHVNKEWHEFWGWDGHLWEVGGVPACPNPGPYVDCILEWGSCG